MAFEIFSVLLIGIANFYFFSLFFYIMSKIYLKNSAFNFWYVLCKRIFEGENEEQMATASMRSSMSAISRNLSKQTPIRAKKKQKLF